MKKKPDPAVEAAELRRRAEAQHGQNVSHAARPETQADAQHLVHELQVHQIELEMQNEELNRMRAEVDAGLESYTDLYDFAPIGYFTLAADGKIHQANLHGAHLLGIPRAPLEGVRFGLFVTDADRPTFNAFLQRVFSGQNKEVCEVTLYKEESLFSSPATRDNQPAHQGSLREKPEPCVVQIEAVIAENRQTCRAVVMDISEHKQVEDALRQSEENYRLLFEQSADGIFIADEAGNFIDVNPSACTLLGYTREEMIHFNMRDLAVFEIPAKMSQRMDELKGGTIVTSERKLQHKNGTRLHVEIRGQTLPDGRLLGIARDITERKLAEEKLNEQIEELSRWHAVTLGREMRILELKAEVNALLAQAGQPARYNSQQEEGA